MKNKLLKMTVLGFASYALVAGQVSAAPIFFNDRAAFDAAAGLLNFESFEGDWLNGGSSASFGGFTLSETGGTNIIHR
ncbi:hypothetical protein, partial [Kaarinaea lacus]